jgi:Flp pilus assembly protein TadD
MRIAPWFVVLAVVTSATVAHADDKAAAEAQFVKAKKLMKDGKTAEACEAFAKSQELDPQLGTRYNLGICYQQLGKTASAWVLFRDVAQIDTIA